MASVSREGEYKGTSVSDFCSPYADPGLAKNFNANPEYISYTIQGEKLVKMTTNPFLLCKIFPPSFGSIFG
jgi:hypothetical protein